MIGEFSGDDQAPGSCGVLVEVLCVALLLAGGPDAVAYQVSVEYVGTNEERVMGFQAFPEGLGRSFQDRACE